MTRVLMVYRDIDIADIEAGELREAGYEVDRCSGPVGGAPCPVLNGEPCWQAEMADVLVYDVWESGHDGPDLVAGLRAIHPDKPLVLTSQRSVVDPVEVRGDDGVTTVFHAPTRATLTEAIAGALRAPRPSTAEVTAQAAAWRTAHAFHGPRW
jgi:DNA-binding response OmpR family regulator